MGGVYEPAVVYSLPEWLAQRVRTQGLSVTETILTAQVAARAGDSDHTIHDYLESHRVKIHNAKASGQGG